MNKYQTLEDDIASKFTRSLSKNQQYYRNKNFDSKYSYCVIDGFNTPNQKQIKCIDVPKDIDEIVFTSDGYLKPFGTLKESEDYLRYIKEIDPLCYKEFPALRGFYKNQVSYDDRAYIRFNIS